MPNEREHSRAARHGRLLGINEPFLGKIADVVLDTMGEYAPEVLARRDFILHTIAIEEESFQRTLKTGLDRFDLITAGAKAGEVVMLSPACASFDQFSDYEARGDAFRRAVEGLSL